MAVNEKVISEKPKTPRKTLTAIPNPSTFPPSLQLDLSSTAGDRNTMSSIVFYDASKHSTGLTEASLHKHNQLVQFSKNESVAIPHPTSVAKARQDARVHIFTAALLEHVCTLYEPNQYRQRKVLQELCAKLTERDMLSPLAFLDVFSMWREKYQIGFSELMRSTVNMVAKDPLLNAPLTSMVDPAQIGLVGMQQLSLITTPAINGLMRSPSDPRSSFFSSRYSNDFHEIKAIGSGGFGSVFKMRNKLDEVLYAIKKVRLKNLNHEKCRKLLREVKVLATLNHPSIVRYNSAWLEQEAESKLEEVTTETEASSSAEVDSIESAGAVQATSEPFEKQRIVLFIQMELCYSNLHDWLSKRNNRLFTSHSSHNGDVCALVHESENMHLTRQLLNGLDYIHTQGIIHRDIKTRNIFIGNRGALKIGDFGLARDVVASPSPTSNSGRTSNWTFDDSMKLEDGDLLSKGIGTSVYCSPEQQNERIYDYKTDIYSAGIIVFELYCPFATEMERYDKIKGLRKDKAVPGAMVERWAEQMSMLTIMVDLDPDKRPSAKQLLSSDLYLDKDQIISHLESRVEDLETKIGLMRKEKQILQESLKVETSDYALFMKWKASRDKSL